MFVLPNRAKHISTEARGSSSRGGQSRAELESLGERNGYQNRELSAAEVRNLSADEYKWFETFFPHRLEKAAEIDANKRSNAQVKKTMEARNFWTRYWQRNDQPATPEEAAKHRVVIERFTRAFPQFLTDRKENSCVLEFMKENDLDFTYPNLVKAYEACVLSGRAVVSPAKINAGNEDAVTGDELVRHRAARLLMMPQSRPDDVSADEFYKQHKELHPGKPYLIKVREAREAATRQHQEQTEKATERAGVTTFVDYAAGNKLGGK